MTTTTHEAQAAHTNVLAATADAAGTVAGSTAGSSSTATPTPKRKVARAYERFLGLPVWVVLALMWAAGVAILGSCVLVLYVVGSVLLQAVAGSS